MPELPDPLARIGFGIAILGFLAGVIGSAIFGGIYAAITGADLDAYGVAIAGLFGLWAGTFGVPGAGLAVSGGAWNRRTRMAPVLPANSRSRTTPRTSRRFIGSPRPA